MTVAQIRNKAWDAMKANRFLEAAELYEQALAIYPVTPGQLCRDDMANLKARAKQCRSMVKADCDLAA